MAQSAVQKREIQDKRFAFVAMICRPTSIIVCTSEIRAAQGQLIGCEAQLLVGAVPRRQREIIGGRVLARRAMVEMGHNPMEVGQRPNGAPIWPTGLCGSLAHSHSHVAVALARSAQMLSVGIDIDDGRNLGAAASQVGMAEELRTIGDHPLADGIEGAARLLFSAKEALFKCQSSLTQNEALGLLDVQLMACSTGCLVAAVSAHVESSVAEIVARTHIIIEIIQGITVAVAWVEV